MPLNTTPKSPSADSYASLAEATAYHAARLHNAEWAAADVATQEAAMRWAAKLLDQEKWKGTRTDEAQALRWPRAWVEDVDGYGIDSDVVPRFLKEAQSELAFLLLKADRTADSGTEGFSRLKVGPIELDVDKEDRQALRAIGPAVYAMIQPYLEAGGGFGGNGAVRLSRG